MRALGLLGVYSSYAALLALAVIAVLIGFVAPVGPARSLKAFTPAAFVVAASLAQLYAFLFRQSASAFEELARLKREAKARGERAPTLADVKYSGKYDKVLAADRCMGNYLEQLLPFILSLTAYSILSLIHI